MGGLLTTLPVLGFGAFAPLAPRLSRRVSIERLLVACALLTAVAAALRVRAASRRCCLGCALAGFAVAIAQALLPVFIRARHPSATGVLTGAYSMSLTLGAALAAALAVPLEEWLGSWEASLAAWAVPGPGGRGGVDADGGALAEPGRRASRRRGCGATGWRGR